MAKKPEEEAFCFAVIAIRLRLLPPFFIKEKKASFAENAAPLFFIGNFEEYNCVMDTPNVLLVLRPSIFFGCECFLIDIVAM